MNSLASPLPNVNLKLLQTFLQVSEHSSFRVAAEKTFRSPSAVSAQVRQLEEQLGVSLFHRTTRSVRLTEEGHQLLECAQRALQEVGSGLRKIQESADVKRGRVALSCSPTIAETRLARVLAAFEQDYPGIEVSVRELTSTALFESVRRREVDFGIGPKIETSDFSFETVLDDPFYALVPKRFISTSKSTIALSTLAGMPMLVLNTATALRGMLEATLKERNLTISNRYEFTQAQTLISMATAGLGAAILPKVALPAKLGPSVYSLRIVKPPLLRQVAVITLRGQALSPASLRLVQLLRQLIADPAEKRVSEKPKRSRTRT
ncbi:LysR family transcriptional regulator [Variovorax ginsengisoli]|uniref:LysR substrate-binding domain-containing protein n=1 Tax=Variovorax ginsengisoli TaxID=363844 RepID=A0ABT8S7N6_9BURK|nr:LysR family transcriptional regulator [Variovorax ginsengisoli]MDN8615648.1 LysR substrate-binding domain-containing protein [Variovorax ginsengisoli]MDO1534818.1 LysR substrate-binding domain-containing protein [Variovorax ginsengisoli]